MRRREFIALAGSATLAGSLGARAQQSGKLPTSDSSARLRLRLIANGLLPLYNGCTNWVGSRVVL
jgi:hypothetical protein